MPAADWLHAKLMFMRYSAGAGSIPGWLAILAGLMLLVLQPGSTAADPAQARDASGGIALTLDGPIGPATSAYVEQGLDRAQQQNAGFVILRIDTPGGLDAAMRDIIKAILASPVPVISYVTPAGARAASAGTYILYASHIAAMTPATNLGAATPVSLGGSGKLPGADAPDSEARESGDKAEPQTGAANNDSAKRNKVVNDAVAYIRSLAERRGRNADWAEKAVREGASLSSAEAMKLQVIDLVAANESDLLAKIDGRSVETSRGPVEISSANATITPIEPDWRHNLLSVITNPSVAYILMMIGIYGLILEGYSPGALIPGITGAICLVMALFAFQVLPVNFAGLALIALGVALMVAEVFAPSFGVLGIGGTVAFVAGSVLLMDTRVPGYQLHFGIVAGLATASAGLMFLIIWLFARSRRQPVTTGSEGLVGGIAEVIDSNSNGGRVFIHGENWIALAPGPLQAGAKVRVTAVRGLKLDVEPVAPAISNQE